MKTNEFIKSVEKLGYYPYEDNVIIKVTRSQTIPVVFADVAINHQNVLRTDYFPFVELPSEKQAELLDVLIEYARTPIDEREEEPLYEVLIPLEKFDMRTGKTNVKYQKLVFNREENETWLVHPNHMPTEWGGRLTEQEIKSIDERFWPFAVKVEEAE